MPVDSGSTTQSTAQAATAASTALPPDRSTSIAASVAAGCDVAAMARVERAAERPGIWKSRMAAVSGRRVKRDTSRAAMRRPEKVEGASPFEQQSRTEAPGGSDCGEAAGAGAFGLQLVPQAQIGRAH